MITHEEAGFYCGKIEKPVQKKIRISKKTNQPTKPSNLETSLYLSTVVTWKGTANQSSRVETSSSGRPNGTTSLSAAQALRRWKWKWVLCLADRARRRESKWRRVPACILMAAAHPAPGMLLDSRYQEEALQSKLQHETFAHPQGIVPGLVLLVGHWHLLSWTGIIMLLINALLLAPWLTYISRHNRSFYREWRTPLIWFLIFQTLSAHFYLVDSDQPPNPDWASVLGRVVLKSPCGSALFYSLNFSLDFRQQIMLQLCTLPSLLKWGSMFCSICDSAQHPLNDVFHGLGSLLDRVLLFFLHTPHRGPEFGCLPVVSTLIILTGFLIPVALVYFLDIVRRGAFVSRNCPEGAVCLGLHQSISDSRELGACYFLAGLELGWIGCNVYSRYYSNECSVAN
ncbi:hypothetical protein BSKO_10569 [Bryopsis sp. KO-2023]|nr:hypothetical protein BSKO_10569 [Bryopsis sp. KO-2023]